MLFFLSWDLELLMQLYAGDMYWMWKFLASPLAGGISELGLANVFDLISTLLNSVLHVLWKYLYSATYLVA